MRRCAASCRIWFTRVGDVPAMINTDVQVLTDQLLHQSSDTAFFIAEDERGIPLGFVHLETGKDYYYHEKHAHIANVIVAPQGQGRGIGRMLIEKRGRMGTGPRIPLAYYKCIRTKFASKRDLSAAWLWGRYYEIREKP